MGEWLGEKEASAFHTVELYSNEQAPFLPSGFLPDCRLEGLSETVVLIQIKEDHDSVSQSFERHHRCSTAMQAWPVVTTLGATVVESIIPECSIGEQSSRTQI